MSADRKITLTVTDAVSGADVEHTLPTKFVVCHGCSGKGTHVNRAIDGNGLSAEDFAEDPDFRESYFAGDYDVTCDTCGGDRVVPVVDEERCKPELLKAYKKQQREETQYRAECEAERRWEYYAGGGRD